MPAIRSISTADPVTINMVDGQTYSATYAQIAALPGNNGSRQTAIVAAISSKLANHGVYVHIYRLAPFDVAILIVEPGQAAPPGDWWARSNPLPR